MIPLGVLASGYVAPAGGLWTPADLTLVAWFDASDTDSITHNAGAVSQWADKSGNGYHVTQSTEAWKPATGTHTLNGLNVLWHNNDHLHNLSVTMPRPFTIGAVYQIDPSAPDKTYRFWGALAPDSGATGAIGRRSATWGIYDGNAVGHPNSSSFATTDPHAHVGVFNGSSSVYSIDGTRASASLTAGTTGRLHVGAYADGAYSPLVGRMAEIVIASGALTGTDLSSLEDYLMTKWGIS